MMIVLSAKSFAQCASSIENAICVPSGLYAPGHDTFGISPPTLKDGEPVGYAQGASTSTTFILAERPRCATSTVAAPAATRSMRPLTAVAIAGFDEVHVAI